MINAGLDVIKAQHRPVICFWIVDTVWAEPTAALTAIRCGWHLRVIDAVHSLPFLRTRGDLRGSRTVRDGPSYLNCLFRKGLAMTADVEIDQLSAFLARRAIELNCFDALLALLKPRLNRIKYRQTLPPEPNVPSNSVH